MSFLLEASHKKLIKYNDSESFLKEYYHKHGKFCPKDVMMEHENIMGTFFGNLTIDTYSDIKNTAAQPSVELSEHFYFRSGEDVMLVKHQRYSPPMEHHHTFFEIMYVYEGRCLNNIDNKKLILEKGDVCIIPPKVVHSISVADDSIVINLLVRTSTFERSFTSILLASDILATFFGEIVYSNKYRKYLLFHTDPDDLLIQTIQFMYLAGDEKANYYSQMMNGYLQVFMGALLQRHEDSVEYPAKYFESQDLIPKILNYIKTNASSITLETCGNHFHFSERYLASILKKETGLTFPQLITAARMDKAKTMLKQREISMHNIACDLGYNDSSYFIRVFKREIGCTPAQYRKNNDMA